MAFDPQLGDAVSRIRFALGDTATSALLPEATYLALLTLSNDDERQATRLAAGALAAEYAQKPDSISDTGTSVSWRERVAQWNRIASGEGMPPSPDPTPAARGVRIGSLSAGTGWTPR